ncbi:MAG TPA: pitrilysin family protein [Oscillatoriaceae cyanobacterium]
MQFRHAEHQQMGLHTLVTDKFKTTALVLNIQRPLLPGLVTRSALLPHVLTRGSARYPSVRAMQRQLDGMYGSYLHGDVYKLGERQIVQFRLEIPNGKYLPGKPELLEEAIAFLDEVLTEPVRENGLLKESFVALEKDALRRRVEGLFNSKMQYAVIRALEVMCEHEPYRLYSGGRIEDLAAITPATLTADYEEMLATAPMDLFVVGDVDADLVEALVKRRFRLPERSVQKLPPTSLLTTPAIEKHVEDRFDVNQGQLVIGLRAPAHYASDDHYTMMAYNGVLGAFAHSKLFMNVRERESLAYTARSRYDSQKGLLMIQAGIDIGNYEKALRVIREQLDAMVAGDISDVELEQTRAMLLNTYREAYDSPGALINLAFESRVAGRERSIEDLIAAIPHIGKEEIQRVARGVKLDTIYFLRDKETVSAHA